jgi:hypothetical protein
MGCRGILARSLHLPFASTEGDATENLNKNQVRLWTDCDVAPFALGTRPQGGGYIRRLSDANSDKGVRRPLILHRELGCDRGSRAGLA